MAQQALWVMANDAFSGLWSVIDEAMNVVWTMFNDTAVTDEAVDVRRLLMCF